MSEVFVLLKIAAAIIGTLTAIVGMVSFALWQNPFRHVKPIFVIRCTVALIVYSWFLYFLMEHAA